MRWCLDWSLCTIASVIQSCRRYVLSDCRKLKPVNIPGTVRALLSFYPRVVRAQNTNAYINLPIHTYSTQHTLLSVSLTLTEMHLKRKQPLKVCFNQGRPEVWHVCLTLYFLLLLHSFEPSPKNDIPVTTLFLSQAQVLFCQFLMGM